MTPLPTLDFGKLLLVRAAADLLPDDEAHQLLRMLKRLERGAPPLASARERALIAQLPATVAARVGPNDLRTTAAHWLAGRVGV